MKKETYTYPHYSFLLLQLIAVEFEFLSGILS